MAQASPLYRVLASCIAARKNCAGSQAHVDWFAKWTDRISKIERELLPRGAGFDSGSEVNLTLSTEERIVIQTSFHHMNESGFYDGWTDHTIVVTGSLLSDFNLRITGRNRNDWKDYAYQTFEYALSRPVVWNVATNSYTEAK
jgi:hypothetical protein